MADDQPSNAVLSTKIDNIMATMAVNQALDHEAHVTIIAQVTKTNGRTTSLEKSRNMGMGILIFIVAVILPIIIAYISTHK